MEKIRTSIQMPKELHKAYKDKAAKLSKIKNCLITSHFLMNQVLLKGIKDV